MSSKPLTKMCLLDQTAFSYNQLSAKQIRLVKLYPRDIVDNGAAASTIDNTEKSPGSLLLDFLTTSLDAHPPYSCISYRWGSSGRRATLQTTKGLKLKVNNTVVQILRRLCPSREHDPILIWIDQLCINQDDTGEKYEQIRIMRRIYSQAAKTIVVLAKSLSNHDLLFSTLSRLRMKPYLLDEDPLTTQNVSSQEMLSIFYQSSFREMIARVATDDVFSRLWIYQEIVFSKRVLVLGITQTVDLDILATALVHCVRIEFVYPLESRLSYPQTLSLIMMINDRQLKLAGMMKNWMRLMIEAQGLFHCSEARDHYFAIESANLRLDTDLDWSVYVSSKRDWNAIQLCQIWQMVGYKLLIESQSLDFFAALSGNWQDVDLGENGLPSWTPDWARGRDSGLPFAWPVMPTSYDAARGFKFEFQEDVYMKTGMQCLIAKGRKINFAKSLITWSYGSIDLEPNTPLYLSLDSIVHTYTEAMQANGNSVAKTGTEVERSEILRRVVAALTASFPHRTFLTDVSPDGRPPDSLYDEIAWMIEHHDTIVDPEKDESDYPTFNGLPHNACYMWRKFGHSWKFAMRGLRQWLAILEGKTIVIGEGQEFGLVPRAIALGDIICILHGSKVPIVLRPYGGFYRVIGQCYWHDWMYGDNVDWSEDEGDVFALV